MATSARSTRWAAADRPPPATAAEMLPTRRLRATAKPSGATAAATAAKRNAIGESGAYPDQFPQHHSDRVPAKGASRRRRGRIGGINHSVLKLNTYGFSPATEFGCSRDRPVSAIPDVATN